MYLLVKTWKIPKKHPIRHTDTDIGPTKRQVSRDKRHHGHIRRIGSRVSSAVFLHPESILGWMEGY